ncbi:MAG: VOC family protein [Cohaesibacter sp.]|nr:VOC family protein [Cohaesibacter sp.]
MNMPFSHPVLRVARSCQDFDAIKRFYCEGLGFELLGAFEGHNGFDGLIIGHPQAPYHLEFTIEHGVIAPKAPDHEGLLVFYLPDSQEWQKRLDRMAMMGYEPVPSNNDYWDVSGKTYQDPDGYRVVLQNRAWST